MSSFSIIYSIPFVALATIPYEKMEQGFATNSVKPIFESVREKVMLNVLGNEGVYSKPQAELILKDFFTKKSGDKFHFIFKGKETAEGTFAIGIYETSEEKFRVTFQFKQMESNYRLESLSIEKN
jgi:hypothetical protein